MKKIKHAQISGKINNIYIGGKVKVNIHIFRVISVNKYAIFIYLLRKICFPFYGLSLNLFSIIKYQYVLLLGKTHNPCVLNIYSMASEYNWNGKYQTKLYRFSMFTANVNWKCCRDVFLHHCNISRKSYCLLGQLKPFFPRLFSLFLIPAEPTKTFTKTQISWE